LSSSSEELKKVLPWRIKPCFDVSVEVTKAEFETLSPKNRILGCNPSWSIYEAEYDLGINPNAYPLRSAGGHIHIGRLHDVNKADKEEREVAVDAMFASPSALVAMLDIIVGNTCVLIDRDPGNVIRRKVYGRAGEYRMPKHGLEYRTLSNFWLRDYSVMSLVFSLVKMTFLLTLNDREDEFFAAINMDDVRKAINENDIELARKNFEIVQPLWQKIMEEYDWASSNPINRDTLDAFNFFVEKGLDFWFSTNVIKNWSGNHGTDGKGDSQFLLGRVYEELHGEEREVVPF
jgi:hypothetical protein